jgi:hypothetical protein
MGTIHGLESHSLMNEIPYRKASFGHKFWQMSNYLVLIIKMLKFFEQFEVKAPNLYNIQPIN